MHCVAGLALAAGNGSVSTTAMLFHAVNIADTVKLILLGVAVFAATRLLAGRRSLPRWLQILGYALLPVLVIGGAAFAVNSGALNAVLRVTAAALAVGRGGDPRGDASLAELAAAGHRAGFQSNPTRWLSYLPSAQLLRATGRVSPAADSSSQGSASSADSEWPDCAAARGRCVSWRRASAPAGLDPRRARLSNPMEAVGQLNASRTTSG